MLFEVRDLCCLALPRKTLAHNTPSIRICGMSNWTYFNLIFTTILWERCYVVLHTKKMEPGFNNLPKVIVGVRARTQSQIFFSDCKPNIYIVDIAIIIYVCMNSNIYAVYITCSTLVSWPCIFSETQPLSLWFPPLLDPTLQGLFYEVPPPTPSAACGPCCQLRTSWNF